jgi:hypothetical protein
MPAERLLVSYILRVSARAGERHLSLHDLKSGETRIFPSYRALLEYVSRSEAQPGPSSPDAPEHDAAPGRAVPHLSMDEPSS